MKTSNLVYLIVVVAALYVLVPLDHGSELEIVKTESVLSDSEQSNDLERVSIDHTLNVTSQPSDSLNVTPVQEEGEALPEPSGEQLDSGVLVPDVGVARKWKNQVQDMEPEVVAKATQKVFERDMLTQVQSTLGLDGAEASGVLDYVQYFYTQVREAEQSVIQGLMSERELEEVRDKFYSELSPYMSREFSEKLMNLFRAEEQSMADQGLLGNVGS